MLAQHDRTSSLAPGFPGPSGPNAHAMHSWPARGRIGRSTLPCHARQPCRCCRCVSERVQAHPARSKSKSTAEPAIAPHKQLSTPWNRAEQADITARPAASVSVEGSNAAPPALGRRGVLQNSAKSPRGGHKVTAARGVGGCQGAAAVRSSSASCPTAASELPGSAHECSVSSPPHLRHRRYCRRLVLLWDELAPCRAPSAAAGQCAPHPPAAAAAALDAAQAGRELTHPGPSAKTPQVLVRFRVCIARSRSSIGVAPSSPLREFCDPPLHTRGAFRRTVPSRVGRGPRATPRVARVRR